MKLATRAWNNRRPFLLVALLSLTANVQANESEAPSRDAIHQLAQQLAQPSDALLRGDSGALRQFAKVQMELQKAAVGSAAGDDWPIDEVLQHANSISFDRKGTIAAVQGASAIRDAQRPFETAANSMLEVLKREGSADQVKALEDSIALSGKALSKISGLGQAERGDSSFIEDLNAGRQLLDDLLNGSDEVRVLAKPDSLKALLPVFRAFNELENSAEDLMGHLGDYNRAAEANRALQETVAAFVSEGEE